jgi:hypothetical protein
MCQNLVVDRDLVIARLREHEGELRAAGLIHVRVFGSTARGEASGESDVDLLVDFDPSAKQSLVMVGSLQSRLSDILEVKVDLSSSDWMREPVRTAAAQEAILAF